jgi:Protein of unknown function (DUF3631)
MARKQTPTAPIFTRVREFIARYCVLPTEELDVVTVWAIGTWAFSARCQWPATYPYLYINGPAGSGKTVLGQDALGCVCRQHTSATGATGSTLFRMLGFYNEETGDIENLAPTLALDEIDTTFSGQKDPDLQRAVDVGYKRGATIPRSAGKTFIAFPVYGPKLFMGIDNGHLPEPVLQRCIGISLTRQSQDDLAAAGIEPFYIFDVEEERAELQEQAANWAQAESMVLRDYRPQAPAGLSARQWEISRSLVQLAHALGNEGQIVKSLLTVLSRNPQRPDHKVELYGAIRELFTELDLDRVTTNQILAKLTERGVRVPGQSGKGLAGVLSADGVPNQLIHLPDGHPGKVHPEKRHEKQRGYWQHDFDGPFVRYLEDDEA